MGIFSANDKLSRFSKWLPTPGNVIVTLLLISMLVWVQSTGAFPLLTAVPSSGVGASQAASNVYGYQGRLADAAGNPLTGTYPMVFRLYSSPGASAYPLWEENWTGSNSVRVSDGLFNVMLGSLTPIPQSVVTENEQLWLGISVNADDEMTPRIQVSKVFIAEMANTVPDGSITSQKIADGTIQTVDLAPNVIVPVGTVISWWRASNATPLPSSEWAIADGSVVNDPTSPLYGQTLPNLTDRFVMGVAAANIGQVGGTNTLNLSHRHTTDYHAHEIPSHSHSDGSLNAMVTVEHDKVYVKSSAPAFQASHAINTGGSAYGNTHVVDAGADVWGETGAWAGTTGGSQPGTDYQLSSSVDNRPQYVGLLFLIKIK